MVIDLGEETAQQLITAASSEGMTVEEFIRTLLTASQNSTSQSPTSHTAAIDQPVSNLVGAMADQADLLDKVLKDAYESRERDPLRVNSDG